MIYKLHLGFSKVQFFSKTTTFMEKYKRIKCVKFHKKKRRPSGQRFL